jgi:hypothetical protein
LADLGEISRQLEKTKTIGFCPNSCRWSISKALQKRFYFLPDNLARQDEKGLSR